MKLAAFRLALATGLLAPVVTAAQPLPLGASFRVNATAAGEQNSPDVAADGADNFRFVWQTAVDEPAHLDVRTRRLQANGSLGTDSLLSESTAGDQRYPRIDMTDAGDWVAAWLSDHEAATGRLYGRFTTTGGTILGAEFAYVMGLADDAWSPSVAVTGEDYFVGGWRNIDGGHAVRGNFRNRAGVQWGVSEIGPAIDSGTPTAVAGLTGDSWVATWQYEDVFDSAVYVRCHAYDDPTEPASLVATDPTGVQRFPDVSSDGASRFVVVWEEGLAVYARLYRRAANGTCEPDSDEIPVSAAGQPALYPSVDMATDGAFVVAWYESTLDADNGVAAREFTKQGTPVGAPFAAHAATPGSQVIGAVATSATTFAITWTTPDTGVGGVRNVQARTFRRRVVFTDGFESDDLAAWSTSQL